jgi:hypothetical protein
MAPTSLSSSPCPNLIVFVILYNRACSRDSSSHALVHLDLPASPAPPLPIGLNPPQRLGPRRIVQGAKSAVRVVPGSAHAAPAAIEQASTRIPRWPCSESPAVKYLNFHRLQIHRSLHLVTFVWVTDQARTPEGSRPGFPWAHGRQV